MAQAFFNQLVKAEWLVQAKKPDRDMKLLESVIFSDPDGKKWTAKEGAIINGASIPGFLWSVFPGHLTWVIIVEQACCTIIIVKIPRAKIFLISTICFIRR